MIVRRPGVAGARRAASVACTGQRAESGRLRARGLAALPESEASSACNPVTRWRTRWRNQALFDARTRSHLRRMPARGSPRVVHGRTSRPLRGHPRERGGPPDAAAPRKARPREPSAAGRRSARRPPCKASGRAVIPEGSLPPVPEWRNGRRAGLKIRFGQPSAGSSPASGTSTLSRARSTPPSGVAARGERRGTASARPERASRTSSRSQKRSTISRSSSNDAGRECLHRRDAHAVAAAHA